jgi:hypothetical protein
MKQNLNRFWQCHFLADVQQQTAACSNCTKTANGQLRALVHRLYQGVLYFQGTRVNFILFTPFHETQNSQQHDLHPLRRI